MITWIDKQDECWDGVFQSSFFHYEGDDPDLTIHIENSSLTDYAEKCTKSLNSLSDSVIDEICRGILKCAKEEGFKLPFWKKPREILKHCWFGDVYVNVPEDKKQIIYIVEGEGEWGNVIGFVIKNGHPVYVGVDYMEFSSK